MIAIGGGIGFLAGVGLGMLVHHVVAGAILGTAAGMIAHRYYLIHH